MVQEELKMTFDPNTIEHLGVRMYSTLPPVLTELIGNSHDADAERVVLILNDSDANKEIVIEDDGFGMSFAEINDKFLRIGRNRRTEDTSEITPKGRKIIGKKGLGKLSFFGVAHEIEITTKKDGKENSFLMKWKDIKKSQKDYKPMILKKDANCEEKDHGTKIVLKDIQRESDFSPENLANSLSKMFIIDPGFEILIKHNSDEPIIVTNERRYTGLEKEVEWKIPYAEYSDDYQKADQIIGHLMAAKKPIPPNTNMRGIILFSRKKLVNLPEYFSDSTSSHFFSYLTGWLEVDFIDELEDDVIATNRQSLNWDHEEMQKLRKHLGGLINWLERDWRKKRDELREKKLKETTGIDIPDWFSKLPADIRTKIEPIVKTIVKDSELSTEAHQEVIKKIHEIAPEYMYYHYRYLHPKIQKIARDDYIKEKYFDAAEKAFRLYVQKVKEKSGIDTGKDDNDMDAAFNVSTGELLVTPCQNPTEKNI